MTTFQRSPLQPIFDPEIRVGKLFVGATPGVPLPALTLTSWAIDNVTYGGAYDVTVHGDVAFVAVGAGGAYIVSVDISDPENPTILDALSDGTHLPAPHSLVYDVDTERLYIENGAINNRVAIVDASDPSNLSIIGSLKDDTNLPSTFEIVSLGVVGFAVVSRNGGFTVLDCSGSAPTVFDSNTLADGSGARGLVVDFDNAMAWLACSGKLVPSSLSGVQGTALSHADLANGVALGRNGDHLFQVGFGGTKLVAADISTPTAPSYVTTLNDATNLNDTRSLIVSGRWGFAGWIGGTAGGVTAVNLTDPANPTVEVALAFDGVDVSGAWGLARSGDYLYVAGLSGDYVLAIVKAEGFPP